MEKNTNKKDKYREKGKRSHTIRIEKFI